jgi:hypothetical protein
MFPVQEPHWYLERVGSGGCPRRRRSVLFGLDAEAQDFCFGTVLARANDGIGKDVFKTLLELENGKPETRVVASALAYLSESQRSKNSWVEGLKNER